MDDNNSEEKYAKLINIKEHIDAIKENLDEDTFTQLKEYMNEYSNPENSTENPILKPHIISGEGNTSNEGIFTRIKDAFEKDVGIDPGRVLGLTDGIFGMVMTLLVFGITVPEILISSYSNYFNFFCSLLPTIGVTIVGFVIISSFWIYHHEFIKLNNLNIPYLWINIFFLISISFIPFSTSLIGSYSKFFLSEILFGINILLVIIFFLLMYVYANKRDFLENKPSKEEHKHVMKTLGSIMSLVIIVNLLDFYISPDFIYLFLLIPVLSTILDIKYQYNNT